jgi:hypothetical protein
METEHSDDLTAIVDVATLGWPWPKLIEIKAVPILGDAPGFLVSLMEMHF